MQIHTDTYTYNLPYENTHKHTRNKFNKNKRSNSTFCSTVIHFNRSTQQYNHKHDKILRTKNKKKEKQKKRATWRKTQTQI